MNNEPLTTLQVSLLDALLHDCDGTGELLNIASHVAKHIIASREIDAELEISTLNKHIHDYACNLSADGIALAHVARELAMLNTMAKIIDIAQ